jgi:hypothetical protein
LNIGDADGKLKAARRDAESEAYLLKCESQDRRDESDEGYRLDKEYRLKAGVPNTSV